MADAAGKRVIPWGEIVIDLVGFASLVLVCAGVYDLFGRGWTLIAAGMPFFAGYVWREVKSASRPRRRK